MRHEGRTQKNPKMDVLSTSGYQKGGTNHHEQLPNNFRTASKQTPDNIRTSSEQLPYNPILPEQGRTTCEPLPNYFCWGHPPTSLLVCMAIAIRTALWTNFVSFSTDSSNFPANLSRYVPGWLRSAHASPLVSACFLTALKGKPLAYRLLRFGVFLFFHGRGDQNLGLFCFCACLSFSER